MNASSNITARIAYDNLRDWLARAELLGEVREVKGANWQEDIGLAAEAILRAENGLVRAQQVYFTREMQNHHGGIVLVNGYLYGFNNAILTCLDFATGKLMPAVAEAVVGGMVTACKENGCALVGGETAEMPGFYRDGEYDIAGTIVGVVEKRRIVDGRKVAAGDVLVALPSTGLHTNGYSLARAVLFEKFEHDDFIAELGMRLGEALLAVHRSYLAPIRAVASVPGLHGMAHITGGGIIGNTSRIVPKGLALKIDWRRWERPALFSLIQKTGDVPEKDMRRAFNLGVGLIFVASKLSADRIIRRLEGAGERPFVIGEVVNA